MFALFLLAKQSRDLCTVEVHKDWGLEEKGAGRMLLLWVSAVIKHLFSQWGHLSPFQMPLTRVTASPLVFGNGDPFSRWPRDGKGCPGFRKLFILSHFHSWCFLLCLPPSTREGDPTGHPWRLHRVKSARCQRTTAAPHEQGQGWCSGAFHLMSVLPGDKQWQGFLFVSTRMWTKKAVWEALLLNSVSKVTRKSNKQLLTCFIDMLWERLSKAKLFEYFSFFFIFFPKSSIVVTDWLFRLTRGNICLQREQGRAGQAVMNFMVACP